VHGKVAFVALELSGHVLVLLLQTAVGHLGKLVEFHEELADKLFFDWLLVSPGALDLVPKLDLKRFSEGLFNEVGVSHVEVNESALSNVQALQLYLLEQNVEGVQVVVDV
jgi:iron uptake system EfeUOB component EfeO/EfeM